MALPYASLKQTSRRTNWSNTTVAWCISEILFFRVINRRVHDDNGMRGSSRIGTVILPDQLLFLVIANAWFRLATVCRVPWNKINTINFFYRQTKGPVPKPLRLFHSEGDNSAADPLNIPSVFLHATPFISWDYSFSRSEIEREVLRIRMFK